MTELVFYLSDALRQHYMENQFRHNPYLYASSQLCSPPPFLKPKKAGGYGYYVSETILSLAFPPVLHAMIESV